MGEIPADLRASLEDRVREQIAAEVQGDVSALNGFTLPAYRAARIAERDDEPGLSLGQIREFVGHVREAEVESVQVEQFHPSIERFAGCPAAVVVSRVRYNRRNEASRFRCIWVYTDRTWFSTSLGKRWFDDDGTEVNAE